METLERELPTPAPPTLCGHRSEVARAAPRPYQEDALRAIMSARGRGVRRGLMVAATGTGKTSVFVWLIGLLRETGDTRPALVVVHREELLQQAAQRVRDLLPDLRVGIERAEDRVAPHEADVVIASVQTIGSNRGGRLEWLRPGLIILDEAHHALPKSGYGRVVDRWGAEAFVLGCTATPKRLDRLSLHGCKGGIFEEVVFEYPIRQAMDEGYLCPLRGYRLQTKVDLSGVRTRAGDFNEEELARLIVTEERTRRAIQHWKETAAGRRTIAFCLNVEHAHETARLFCEEGVMAQAIDGGMGRDERAVIIDRYRRGEVMVLCNCMIATEGFDAPETACILMLRPTQSWGLYTQQAGRGTRLKPGGGDTIVIDVVDNTSKHSLATVPAMLDLPANLDLEGRSLSEAAAALDEWGERVSALRGWSPQTFSELETALTQVDLFANVETPQEVKAASRLAWHIVPEGYRLSCGGKDERRLATLRQNALGDWVLALSVSKSSGEGWQREIVRRETLCDELETALRDADLAVLREWPEAQYLTGQEAPWRRHPVSEKQRALLLRLGVAPTIINQMTKGEASAFIEQAFSRNRAAGRDRR